MSRTRENGWARRPLVFVEDHLYHIGELLGALRGAGLAGPVDAADAAEHPAGPVATGRGRDLAAQLTVACLDRPGPDTARCVAEWLAACPGLQVVAACAPPEAAGRDAAGERFSALPVEVFENPHRLCQTLAGLLRPGGLLLQDVQLATLGFIAPDRWWESIYLASTVRGMFAANPPSCRFLSNKRGYEATFGRDLLEAGFDPRDVIDKRDIGRLVVPALRSYLDQHFPFTLRRVGEGGELPEAVLGRELAERLELEAELDLLIWLGSPESVELSGRAVAGGARLSWRPHHQEARTWCDLVSDRLAEGPGLPVVDVGRRLAAEGAGRAEMTNLAARHIHLLRGRLSHAGAILTARHAYRLDPHLDIGLVSRSAR